MSQILHDPIRKEDLLNDIEDVVRDADQWLKMPNDQLGGRRPIDMIDASDDKRRQVHDLIESIKHGMIT
jgi:uncharacterized protein (DUF2384 family)